MSIFHKKDEFGRTVYKIPIVSIFAWSSTFVSIILLYSVVLNQLGCNVHSVGFSEVDESLPDSDFELAGEEIGKLSVDSKIDESISVSEEAKFVRYEYFIEEIFTKNLYATCYSKYDSPLEEKGIYANNKYADYLHRFERRIHTSHYTVALNPQMKRYHEGLIKLPDGSWTHKYRVHVPEYNKSFIDVPNMIKCDLDNHTLTKELKEIFDCSYFSIPRDRMRQKDRIDVLFTGYFGAVKNKQRKWTKKNTHDWPCKFYEICKYAVYSDGFRKKVE